MKHKVGLQSVALYIIHSGDIVPTDGINIIACNK